MDEVKSGLLDPDVFF